MEKFAIPGVGGILEKNVNGEDYILIQDRYKEDAIEESGLIEIPAGKIREFENIFDCLRREIKEETGLEITEIVGEQTCSVVEAEGYRVISYEAFSSSQNILGAYPILVQVFICKVRGELLTESNESRNMRWVTLEKIKQLLDKPQLLYPMHVATLKKYLEYKGHAASK